MCYINKSSVKFVIVSEKIEFETTKSYYYLHNKPSVLVCELWSVSLKLA